MTAAATKVKQITVTFNKAVDTTAAKIVVKKGSATPTITSTTFAADAKSAEIAMGTKLTEGTYTVEATIGEDVLSADIAVKDEKLTSFALVSKNLVATATDKTKATISYKALNQYGEMMPADSVTTPTCSFGKVTTGDYSQPTADKSGTITVTDIPDVLAVVGTTGTLVIVDSSTGVTLNETVTYQSKAVAAKATVYGIYDTKKEKLIEGNLKTGDTIGNYQVLVNIQNQYDSDMTPKDIKESECKVSFNPASILTDVTLDKVEISETVNTFDELTYDGKSCILMPLKASGAKVADAGTLNLTIVSANKGVLATPSFTISDAVVIKSLNISTKDTVYSDDENELVVEAVDTNGNAVTKYDDLYAAFLAGTADSGIPDGVTLKKNSDGTGTFWYKPTGVTGSSNDKWKKNELKTLVFKANAPASGNYIVKSINVTVYAKRLGWKVAGVTSDTTTATSVGKNLVFKLKTLNYEDQYSNTLKYSDTQIDGSKISGFLDDPNKVLGATTGGAVMFTAGTDNNLQVTYTGQKKGSATLYLKYKNDAELAVAASTEKYDFKVTLSVVEVDSVVASDLSVKINDGNAIYGVAKAKLKMVEENKTAPVSTSGIDKSNEMDVTVVVTGVVNGKTVVIPADNCTIVDGATLGGYDKVSNTNPAKTEEKTVTVVVESSEGPQTVTGTVTVSNADPAVQSIKAATTKDVSAAAITSGTAITGSALGATVEVKDQYGAAMDKKAEMLYKVTFTGTSAAYQTKDYIVYNETQNVEIKLPAGDYTATVEYKVGGKTFSQDIKIHVNA